MWRIRNEKIILPRRPGGFYGIICVQCHQETPETDILEQRWCPLEEGSKGSFRGSTALLFELEDKVAQAAANVQNAQSEVIKLKQANRLLTGDRNS